MNHPDYKKNIVIATIAIIAIGLAIAPTVFSNVAQAQANKNIIGSGYGPVTCSPPNTNKSNTNSSKCK